MTTINRHLQFNRGELNDYRVQSTLPKSGEPIVHPFNNVKFHREQDKLEVASSSMICRIGTGYTRATDLNYNITNQILQVYKIKIDSIDISTGLEQHSITGGNASVFAENGTWKTLTSSDVLGWNTYSVDTQISVDEPASTDVYNHAHLNPMVINADHPNQDLIIVGSLSNNRELELIIKGSTARTASNVYINIFIYQPFIEVDIPRPIASPAIEFTGTSYWIGFGDSSLGQLGLKTYADDYYEARSLFVLDSQQHMNRMIGDTTKPQPSPAIGKNHVIIPPSSVTQDITYQPANEFYRAGSSKHGQIGVLPEGSKINQFIPFTLSQPTYVNKIAENDYTIEGSTTPPSGIIKTVTNNKSSAFISLRDDPTNSSKKIQSLYTFGENSYGQLGLSDTVDRNIPELLPTFFQARYPEVLNRDVLIKDDIRVTGAGNSGFDGEFVNNDEETWNNKSVYRNIDTPTYAIFYGESTIASVTASGWNIGILDHSQDREIPYYGVHSTADNPPLAGWSIVNAGISPAPSLQVSSAGLEYLNVSDVALGHMHGLLLGDGKVYSWGNNVYGQCGLDQQQYYTVTNPRFVGSGTNGVNNLYAGGFHSLILTDNRHALFAFGKNEFGQLGLRHQNNVSTPEPVLFTEPNAVTLPPFPETITVEFADDLETEDGILNQIGFNGSTSRKYILGRADGSRSEQRYRFTNIPEDYAIAFIGIDQSKVSGFLIKTCREIDGVDYNFYYGSCDITVDISSPITIVTCRADKNIGGYEILTPYFDSNYTIQDVRCGLNHTVVMVKDEQLNKNIVFTCGSNKYGQLATGDNIDRPYMYKLPGYWRSIAAGDNHTVLVSYDYETYSAGDNSSGQLGLSDINIKSSNTLESVPLNLAIGGIHSAYAGGNSTILLTNQFNT